MKLKSSYREPSKPKRWGCRKCNGVGYRLWPGGKVFSRRLCECVDDGVDVYSIPHNSNALIIRSRNG